MKRSLSLIYVACLAVIGLLVAARPAENEGYRVGDTAIDFKLKNVDGKMVSLVDNKKAKGFIVTFTCNTCPYSVAYEDRIIALQRKYEPQGYPVVAINPNDVTVSPKDSFKDMQKRAKEKKFNFAYLQDETQEITKAYGATRTPHMYVLQKQPDNSLKVMYIGAIDDNSREPENVQKKYLENALDELIAGKEISQSATKAIGCTIKWKQS
ncbi:thioredoxin family protein [Adhaeribacter terreus]|uniref:Thioredoxin family protein n=1 Tax=Adhaeribacter terreus TaxID=529703 RepID=A0ABW0E9Y2_9BACT